MLASSLWEAPEAALITLSGSPNGTNACATTDTNKITTENALNPNNVQNSALSKLGPKNVSAGTAIRNKAINVLECQAALGTTSMIKTRRLAFHVPTTHFGSPIGMNASVWEDSRKFTANVF